MMMLSLEKLLHNTSKLFANGVIPKSMRIGTLKSINSKFPEN
jgi:hypothetical protein